MESPKINYSQPQVDIMAIEACDVIAASDPELGFEITPFGKGFFND